MPFHQSLSNKTLDFVRAVDKGCLFVLSGCQNDGKALNAVRSLIMTPYIESGMFKRENCFDCLTVRDKIYQHVGLGFLLKYLFRAQFRM